MTLNDTTKKEIIPLTSENITYVISTPSHQIHRNYILLNIQIQLLSHIYIVTY